MNSFSPPRHQTQRIELDLTEHQIQQLREIIDHHPLVWRPTGECYHATVVAVSKQLPLSENDAECTHG